MIFVDYVEPAKTIPERILVHKVVLFGNVIAWVSVSNSGPLMANRQTNSVLQTDDMIDSTRPALT